MIFDFHHATVEIDKVRLSGLSPELVDRVLGQNSRLLFFGAEDAGSPVTGR